MAIVAQVAFTILSFLAFLFVLVGTPLDQFRLKKEEREEGMPMTCFTYWGYKDKCSSTKYVWELDELFFLCDGRKSRFQAAEAFSIISIVSLLACFLITALSCCLSTCCCPGCKIILCLLSFFGFVCAMIAWAIMVDAYLNEGTKDEEVFILWEECNKLKESYSLGAGFGLTVTGSILAFINVFVVWIPC